MYTVAVNREFIAQHHLTGGDWGAENDLHSHHYRVELQLEGDRLDQHGFLVDIVDIEAALDEIIRRFQGHTLNDRPEFQALNPSVENFSRILCQSLAERIQASTIETITVKLWENELAWASFRQSF